MDTRVVGNCVHSIGRGGVRRFVSEWPDLVLAFGEVQWPWGDACTCAYFCCTCTKCLPWMGIRVHVADLAFSWN